VDEVLSEVERDLVFFDESSGGVTLSGGEPLSQPRFTLELLRACRERAIHATVETCGFAPPAVFQEAAREAALVLFDLKIMNRGLHRRYTGVFNDAILRNLEWLANSGRPAAVRIPVIPGINDTPEDAREFARYLAGIGIAKVNLLPYHRAGTDKYRRLGRKARWTGSPQPMNGFAQALRDAGLITTIGR